MLSPGLYYRGQEAKAGLKVTQDGSFAGGWERSLLLGGRRPVKENMAGSGSIIHAHAASLCHSEVGWLAGCAPLSFLSLRGVSCPCMILLPSGAVIPFAAVQWARSDTMLTS